VSWQTSDYEVRLTRGQESIPAKHASGGEKMAIGISLNLALIHYMAPEVRWLVLDEPTASLDVENRAGLRDVVERLREPMDNGQRLFDQLLFISHESALFEGLGSSLDFPEQEA
ncbi:MAG: hypothetical protein QF464_19450, partial [Myxococcota bacterium]|nr:hypothetical protein [Myxococcota bacterium]